MHELKAWCREDQLESVLKEGGGNVWLVPKKCSGVLDGNFHLPVISIRPRTSHDERPPVRVVVCAALRAREDMIVCGPRHFDAVMHKQIKYLTQLHDMDNKELRWEQGFVDQWGVFMDRYEALQVATDANQIDVRRTKTSPKDRLFSEDLY